MTLRSPSGRLEARFAPDRGMAGESLRHCGQELLGAEQGVADPILREAMSGIPFLHPWANRLTSDRYAFAGREGRVPRRSPFVPRDGGGLPIHGLLAPPDAWEAHAHAAGERLRAQLDFGADRERAAAFPFAHRVTLDVSLSDAALSIRTSLTATADVAVPIAFGFHPYLRLPGSERSTWSLTLPAMRRFDVSPHGIPTGATESQPGRTVVVGEATLDESYADVPEGATFSVEGGGRTLTVRFDAGYPVAQVYSPVGDDVICIEPMTAPVNALVSGDGLRSVEPGNTYAATFTVLVDDV